MRWLAFIAAVILVTACNGGEDDTPESRPPTATPAAPTATPAAETTPTATAVPPTPTAVITGPTHPPPEHAPVTSLPSGDVVDLSNELPTKICSQQIGWRKPGPEAMAPVFQDRRFGDGTVPFPQDYTYYLRDIYFPLVLSASGNKYFTAFGGFTVNPGDAPPEVFCEDTELRAQGGYRKVRALDEAVTGVYREGNTLVIIVEAGIIQGWQETAFPYPPQQPWFSGEAIEVTRVIAVSGQTLYEESAPATSEAWFQTIQYDYDTELEFLNIGGLLPYATTEIEIPQGQPALHLYSSSPAASAPDGSLVAIDEHGAEVGRIDWSGEHGLWQPLGLLSLPPGRYTFRFEDAASDWRHFTLLAEDVPLPPGAVGP